jgi:hypothetical protein
MLSSQGLHLRPREGKMIARGPSPSLASAYFSRLAKLAANPWVREILLTIYYLGILVGLILMYGKGDFSTPSFIYQGF